MLVVNSKLNSHCCRSVSELIVNVTLFPSVILDKIWFSS
jgi:hypothetical protein